MFAGRKQSFVKLQRASDAPACHVFRLYVTLNRSIWYGVTAPNAPAEDYEYWSSSSIDVRMRERIQGLVRVRDSIRRTCLSPGHMLVTVTVVHVVSSSWSITLPSKPSGVKLMPPINGSRRRIVTSQQTISSSPDSGKSGKPIQFYNCFLQQQFQCCE